MGLSLRSLLALGAMLTTALGTQLKLPSQDPWYSPPHGFEKQQPGAILRVREAPSNITILVNNTAKAYQLLFRSTDGRYRASWAVTTVFLPTKANQASRDTRALLSYQIPYNSPDPDQVPSYGLSTIYDEPIMANVREGLSRGWAVSVPDFEGPQAAFSAGLQAGHAVIDSVRAVLAFNKFQGPDPIRYALWGYSGGALASNWAAELQGSYAPELSFAGTALGGMPSNFTQIVYTVSGGPSAAVVPYVLLGVTAQYPEAREYLVGQLHKDGPYNATTFLAALHTTNEQARAAFAGQNIWDYFTNGDGILTAPEMVRVLGNNWFMGYHGIPQMPVFAYKAINDETTLIGTTDDHVDRICRVGANVLYQRNTVGMHNEEYVSGGRRALGWLGQVLDGKHPEPNLGCKVEAVTEAM
ncbi:secretory lipase-domain-containing protein [Parachaetomium inaequale]|uniref:Secretory lipase-domain-containing protein n=1 Tax=Parachaetomium inaequale TaxID=2588326 RepID=A0AAN6SMW6_9PEZI|nr:secretory lipase-domain-containing protein [Parachaetomium inaequale]